MVFTRTPAVQIWPVADEEELLLLFRRESVGIHPVPKHLCGGTRPQVIRREQTVRIGIDQMRRVQRYHRVESSLAVCYIIHELCSRAYGGHTGQTSSIDIDAAQSAGGVCHLFLQFFHVRGQAGHLRLQIRYGAVRCHS